MKMALKNRIAQSLEVLAKGNFQHYMHSNDIIVVFYSSAIFGSQLSKRYNEILMNRNAVPKWWHSTPRHSTCNINSAFKRAYSQVGEYLKQGYNITPGRVFKLLDILSCIEGVDPKARKNLTDNDNLHRYLRNLNNLRMHIPEMTECEIYDFSFDMVYDCIDELSFSETTLCLALLIMYWIQRESELIPLAVVCGKTDFFAILATISDDKCDKGETKKKFRLFMRKLLDLHLKFFIRDASQDSKTKAASRDRILQLIRDNPKHTAKTMASCLELSVQAIQKQIAILKTEKRLKRIGPDNGGKWKVLQG